MDIAYSNVGILFQTRINIVMLSKKPGREKPILIKDEKLPYTVNQYKKREV
jgi:hypothetical protein